MFRHFPPVMMPMVLQKMSSKSSNVVKGIHDKCSTKLKCPHAAKKAGIKY